MRTYSLLLKGLLIAGLVLWSDAPARAAEGDEPEMERLIQELQQEQGLTEAEARELVGQAAGDLDPQGRERTELAHGAPELAVGGTTGGQPLTPEVQAVMERVDTRSRELAAQGLDPQEVSKQLEGEFSREFDGLREKYGDERVGREATGYRGDPGGGFEHSRDVLEKMYGEGRPVGEALEQHQGSSDFSREMTEHFGSESTERPTYEAPTMERSYEAPTVERSYEAPETYREAPEVYREAPEVYRETVERPTYEVERPTYEAPTHEYTPPQS